MFVFFVNVCERRRQSGLCIFCVFRPLIGSALKKHGVFQHRSEAALLHKTPCGFYPSMHWASRRSVAFFHLFSCARLCCFSSVFIDFEESDLRLFTSLHCEDLCFSALHVLILRHKLYKSYVCITVINGTCFLRF